MRPPEALGSARLNKPVLILTLSAIVVRFVQNSVYIGQASGRDSIRP